MKVLITEKLSEHRYKTPEGYLVCVDAILARTGPQVYKHSQVYDGSTDEITDVEVDRKPEQVFSPQAIASFENKPLTIQHPNEPVTIINHKELYHGFARDIRRAIKRNGQILTGSKRPSVLQAGDQEVLVGNIIVTTSEAIEEIENGLEFLSCGYDCDITQTDKPEQINIRGNHIALCDNPRAGITMLQDSVDFDELQKVVNRINKSQSGFVLRIKPSRMKGRSQVDVIKQNEDANFYKTFSSEYALLSKLETSGCAGEILKSSNSKVVISYRMMTDAKYTQHIVKMLTDALDANNIQIPRHSKEFETVIREYYKKYGKILQVESMIYDFETGKYYMYNESTDYSFTSKRIKDSVEDAINYVVMCEVLYNGVAVKSRAPWIVFRSEDKSKAEQFVRENNAKAKSLVGFSKRYYIK